MPTKTKLINRYKKWMEKQKLPKEGLCVCLHKTPYQKDLEQFEPVRKERIKLRKENTSSTWWASGLPLDDIRKYKELTPLRETIILLICAMHDEL